MIINNQKKNLIQSLNKYNKSDKIRSTSMKDKDNKDLKVARELLYKDKEYKASTIKNKFNYK